MHSFDRRAKHSRGCKCIPNILTVRLGLVANREFLTKDARLNLDFTPVRVFDWRRDVMILRSVRKPNRRQSKVRGACTLVVKDRHFLPEGESIGLGRRTCDECAQDTTGGRKRRFGFPSARALTSLGCPWSSWSWIGTSSYAFLSSLSSFHRSTLCRSQWPEQRVGLCG